MSRVIQSYCIEPNQTSVGGSGMEKLYKPEHLKPAAEGLVGCPVTSQPGETVAHTIGEVLYAEYVEDMGVRYEAKVYGEDAIELIEAGAANLVPRLVHESPDPNEEEPYVVRDIEFKSLFVTAKPCDCVPELGPPGMEPNRKI